MKSNPPRVTCVEIGGISIALSTCHERFADLLLQRYAGFLATSPPEFGLEFQIVDAAEASDEDVCVRREGREWRIDRGDFSARWDPRTGTGQVRQNANPYSLDSVLRIVHSLILAERGGFLLHAASAICDGRAYLFSGVSGAGKTTITRLAPPDVTLLTDEISYVRPENVRPGSARPENVRPNKDAGSAAYRAFGTPFSGELAKAGENCSAPVAALFFLEQGPENRIDEIPSAEAVRRLMRNILFFAGDPDLVANLLATACDFVARVPIRRLTFYPDSKVWDHIRQFEERQFSARQSGVGGQCGDGPPRLAGQSPATTQRSVGEPAHV